MKAGCKARFFYVLNYNPLARASDRAENLKSVRLKNN